jgi:1,4-dihydroxy-2-naphthoyl-CoA hydrolase
MKTTDGDFTSGVAAPPVAVWRRSTTPQAIERRFADYLPGLLGIRILEIGPDLLRAEMPVDRRHAQPAGLLHGGASVVLSETLGTVCAFLASPEGAQCVGLEVNANHLAGVREGTTVTATCRPLHIGRSTQVWQTEIHRADGKLACVSRLTVAVLPPAP